MKESKIVWIKKRFIEEVELTKEEQFKLLFGIEFNIQTPCGLNVSSKFCELI